MNQPQKSPNWDSRNSLAGTFVEKGFPFNEGFPQHPLGSTFTLITRDGEVHKGATLCSTRQYATEGPKWQTPQNKTIGPAVVICWIEEESNTEGESK